MGSVCLTLAERRNTAETRAPIKECVVSSPYPALELLPDESFYQHVQRRFLERPDKPALERDGKWLSFAKVLSLMDSYASGFQKLGVSAGCHVCVNVSNSAASLLASYALCCTGAAVVLAKPSLTEREILYQVQDSGATFILTEKQNVDKILNIHQTCPFKGLFSIEPVDGFHCVQDFEKEDGSSFEEPFVDDARAHIMVYTYTSGTTGLPKGVEISMYAFIASVELCRVAELFYEEEVFLGWNPLSHASGFILPMIALCCGAKVVPSRGGLSANEFVDVVNEHQVTTLCAFPTAFRKLVFSLEPGLTPSLKRILMCGTVCHEDLYRRIMQVVESHTGKPLGPGETGEIVFRSPHLMRGYHNRPDATAEVIDEHRWFRSGDAGYYDNDGKLYVVERVKDMIKCLDQQVAPAEIEALLSRHPLVLDSAVVGIEHPDFGEAPTAFVVAEPSGKGRIEEELRQLVSEQAAFHKHLHGGVVFIDSIPKTDTGKYMRRQLRSQYLATLGKAT
ncbi:uncharacterized protein LOC142584762 isoform X2 [Dermacentor variabilis]|uniref:uncharacterized protein LOC142584762 isoform X2 n=1 Tax=Dermacentor variabilis TaxID=34621 RepID=UPI003F5B20B5